MPNRKMLKMWPVFAVVAIAGFTALVFPCCGEESGNSPGDESNRWKQKYESLSRQVEENLQQTAALKVQNRTLSEQLASLSRKLGAVQDENHRLKEKVDSLSRQPTQPEEQAETGLPTDPSEQEHPQRGKPTELPEGENREVGAGRSESPLARRVRALEKALGDAEARARRAAARLRGAAIAAFRTGRYGAALPMLVSAVELGSDDPEALFQIAYCLGRAGDRAGAEEQYAVAIAQMEKDPLEHADLLKKACNNRGAMLARLDRPEEALPLYQKALGLDENYAPVHFNLGLLYQRQLRDPEAAMEAFRRHIALGGTHSKAARDAILALQPGRQQGSGQTEKK